MDYPKLLFYKPFQKEVDELVIEAREAQEKKKARNAEICAKIEKQIEQMQKQKIIIVRQTPKRKEYPTIDLAAIADMEDDDDGAMPQNDLKHLFEKTDSK